MSLFLEAVEVWCRFILQLAFASDSSFAGVILHPGRDLTSHLYSYFFFYHFPGQKLEHKKSHCDTRLSNSGSRVCDQTKHGVWYK